MIVAVFPADHHIAREGAFMSHVAEMAQWAASHPHCIALLGARPAGPETEYGWIEPGEPLDGVRSGAVHRIGGFREKPSPAAARDCFERGCLWNTFVMVASVSRSSRRVGSRFQSCMRAWTPPSGEGPTPLEPWNAPTPRLRLPTSRSRFLRPVRHPWSSPKCPPLAGATGEPRNESSGASWKRGSLPHGRPARLPPSRRP